MRQYREWLQSDRTWYGSDAGVDYFRTALASMRDVTAHAMVAEKFVALVLRHQAQRHEPEYADVDVEDVLQYWSEVMERGARLALPSRDEEQQGESLLEPAKLATKTVALSRRLIAEGGVAIFELSYRDHSYVQTLVRDTRLHLGHVPGLLRLIASYLVLPQFGRPAPSDIRWHELLGQCAAACGLEKRRRCSESGDSDRTVQVWDLRTRSLLSTVPATATLREIRHSLFTLSKKEELLGDSGFAFVHLHEGRRGTECVTVPYSAESEVSAAASAVEGRLLTWSLGPEPGFDICRSGGRVPSGSDGDADGDADGSSSGNDDGDSSGHDGDGHGDGDGNNDETNDNDGGDDGSDESFQPDGGGDGDDEDEEDWPQQCGRDGCTTLVFSRFDRRLHLAQKHERSARRRWQKCRVLLHLHAEELEKLYMMRVPRRLNGCQRNQSKPILRRADGTAKTTKLFSPNCRLVEDAEAASKPGGEFDPKASDTCVWTGTLKAFRERRAARSSRRTGKRGQLRARSVTQEKDRIVKRRRQHVATSLGAGTGADMSRVNSFIRSMRGSLETDVARAQMLQQAASTPVPTEHRHETVSVAGATAAQSALQSSHALLRELLAPVSCDVPLVSSPGVPTLVRSRQSTPTRFSPPVQQAPRAFPVGDLLRWHLASTSVLFCLSVLWFDPVVRLGFRVC
ncbi:MAG: hypothetical protein MHM6MM_008295 [Cercozoa sp. M6MM]